MAVSGRQPDAPENGSLRAESALRRCQSPVVPLRKDAEIPSYAASLGSPAVTYAVAERLDVPASMPLIRRAHAYLVAGVAVYSWLSPSQLTWLVSDETSGHRLIPDDDTTLRIAWYSVFACGTLVCGSLVAFARRRRRLALRMVCVAGLLLVVGVAFVGHRLIQTNSWFETVLLWSDREYRGRTGTAG